MPGRGGKYCPSVLLKPRTIEGVIAAEIGGTAGLWQRAGQSGTVVGLDWKAALDLIPPDADRPRIIALLKSWEGGLIAGCGQREKIAAEEARRRGEAGA